MARDQLKRHQSPLLGEMERWDFAWYNVWQPIDREVVQNPLTVLDASTVDAEGVVEYVVTETGEGIASLPLPSPAHRLYYFSRMQTDEVIVFKQLDSRPDVAQVCPHTSFYDPAAPDDAPGRRSIEMRVMCAFPRAA